MLSLLVFALNAQIDTIPEGCIIIDDTSGNASQNINSSNSNLTTNHTPCDAGVSFSDYELTTPFVLYVNFYVQDDIAPAVAIPNIHRMVEWMNNYLDQMPVCQQTGPNGQIPAHVPKGKFRIEIYTETDNAADIYDGIWFEQIQPQTNFYLDRTTEIRLEANGSATSGRWSRSSEFIIQFGFSTQDGLSNDSRFGAMCRSLLHEIGHSLSLDHTT
jgi:hypothetical protein